MDAIAIENQTRASNAKPARKAQKNVDDKGTHGTAKTAKSHSYTTQHETEQTSYGLIAPIFFLDFFVSNLQGTGRSPVRLEHIPISTGPLD
jgi:hypothetical protein